MTGFGDDANVNNNFLTSLLLNIYGVILQIVKAKGEGTMKICLYKIPLIDLITLRIDITWTTFMSYQGHVEFRALSQMRIKMCNL